MGTKRIEGAGRKLGHGTNRLDYYAKWREAGRGKYNTSVIGAKEKFRSTFYSRYPK